MSRKTAPKKRKNRQNQHGALFPPFTEEQIESIDLYQRAGSYESIKFPSKECRERHSDSIMMPTKHFLLCPLCGGKVYWVFPWIANWSWRTMELEAREILTREEERLNGQ